MSSPNATLSEEFVHAAETSRQGVLRETWSFLRQNKKWWLTPIVVVLMLVSLLVLLSATAAAPFIYTLF